MDYEEGVDTYSKLPNFFEKPVTINKHDYQFSHFSFAEKIFPVANYVVDGLCHACAVFGSRIHDVGDFYFESV
jgi:hypothetical protein